MLSDARLRQRYSPDVLTRLELRFLADPPIAVTLGPRDGVIRTSGPLDRDALPACRKRDSCEVTLDVTVQPVDYFRIIKVCETSTLAPCTTSAQQ